MFELGCEGVGMVVMATAVNVIRRLKVSRLLRAAVQLLARVATVVLFFVSFTCLHEQSSGDAITRCHYTTTRNLI